MPSQHAPAKKSALSADGLYRSLPCWAQHCAISGYGVYWYWLRFGPGYSNALQKYLERERFTAEQWAAWSEQERIELLSAAADHVPYYRETWSTQQKTAARAGRIEELPLLDKQLIRSTPKDFLRTDKKARPQFVYHTSGSTGTPIATYWSAYEMRKSMAIREARSTRWASVSFLSPRATFSGRLVEPEPTSTGPFYRFNAVEKQVYLSAFHLRPETAADYARAFRKHDLQWGTGYAVSFYVLARFIVEQGLPPLQLKAVITTSEKLTREMRKTMQQAYGCRIFEEYGSVENSFFASECEAGQLHVSPDVGLVEILRPDGSPCLPGEVGEVVATGFLRTHQIFVRYRIGDLACWAPEPCSCGRAMPVIQDVIGRLEDIVVGRDGRKLVRFHAVFTNQPHIKEGQVIQEARDRIILRVVTTSEFSYSDRCDLIARTARRVGPGIEIRVEPVESIGRSKAGKFKAVISLLSAEERGTGTYTEIDEAGEQENSLLVR